MGGEAVRDPLYRRILSQGGTWLANWVLKTHYEDMTSGFEAFRRNVLEDLNFEKFLSRGHIYQTEMRYYCRGYKYKEVPIHYIAGDSSLGFGSVKEAFSVLFRMKANEPNIFMI